MNFKEKFIAGIIAMIFLTSMIPVTAMAETPIKFVVGSVSGNPGDTVNVPIIVSDNSGISGIQMDISFDSNSLEYVSSSFDSNFGGTGVVNIADNAAKIVWWSGNSAINSNGTIVTVTFRIKPVANLGNSPLTVMLLRVSDFNEVLLDSQATSGDVGIISTGADTSPKLWVTGGDLKTDGSAVVNVVLDDINKDNSGEFTLNYDPSKCTLKSIHSGSDVASATIKSPLSNSEEQTVAGTVNISWTNASSNSTSIQILVLEFSSATVGSQIGLSYVSLKDSAGSALSGIKVYNGTIKLLGNPLQTPRLVSASIDKSSGTAVDLKIDIATSDETLNGSTKALNLIIVLYESGRLKMVKYNGVDNMVFDKNGLSEFTISAIYSGTVDTAKVFLLDSGEAMSPWAETVSCFVQ